MEKILSLIKVSLNHDMNIFKVNSKKQGKLFKVLFPTVLILYLMFVSGVYSELLINGLEPMHLEFAVLSIFGLVISFMTLIEGIYKSSALLFNCKDDDLLLSLPIKRNTIIFVRLFKFYIFEFVFNSLFILPSMVIYAYHMKPVWTYYLVSFVALILLPIVPILLSCIIGTITSFLSSKFKHKNILQSIISIFLALIIMVLSFKTQGFVENLAVKAKGINDMITNSYYPIGEYIALINGFNIFAFIKYIAIHIAIIGLVTLCLSKFYFRINSSTKKEFASNNKKKKYIIKKRNRACSFIHKEINKFLTTPVFITNAGFGLIIFILMCILSSIKFDSAVASILKETEVITIDMVKSFLPLILYGLIIFSSFMTSITSSMISLEGKSFSVLKSLPLKPSTIVMYKVLTAVIIITPCLLLGDFIVFIRFGFNIIDILLLIIASVIFPLLTQMLGIIVNLRYPKLDATNDTEIVKQSMSSNVSVFLGLGLIILTGVGIFALFSIGLNTEIIIVIVNFIYILICFMLWLYLKKNCVKFFNDITN